MKRVIILSILSISFLQFACRNEKIKPISFIEVCKTTIDSTLSFDPALNEGDTLFLEFPKASDLSKQTKKAVIDWIQEKYKLKVILSTLDELTINDTSWRESGTLKNFFVNIRSIESQGKNRIIITSQKYKGTFAAVDVETIFEYKEGNWICVSSRITCMS